MERPTEDDVVTVKVGNKVIQTTTKHRELSEEALKEVEETLMNKKSEISEAVENWYPSGFANLTISGNSKFVRFMQKHGKTVNEGTYEFGKISVRKRSSKGYGIYFDYSSDNPVEAQSLNFKRPFYGLFQDLLGLLGVSTELKSRID